MFDLASGSVRLTAGEPQVLVSASIVGSLVASAPNAREMGRLIGADLAGRARIRRAMTGGGASEETMRSLTLGDVVDLLGGELAILGLGNLRSERWGSALLFVLDPCPLDTRADGFLAGIIESAVASAGVRDLRAAVLDHEDRTVRMLICNEVAMKRAEALRAEGLPFTSIVSRLQGLTSEGGGR